MDRKELGCLLRLAAKGASNLTWSGRLFCGLLICGIENIVVTWVERVADAFYAMAGSAVNLVQFT